MTKIYFILIFLISFVTVYAQNESDSAQVTAQTEMPQSAAVQTFPTKTEADSAYIRNDFAASVEMYENILKNEGESSDIYYNLGNSYYKMNNIAKAVLNYERALLLQPGNSDIRANLEVARAKTIDKVEPTPLYFFIFSKQIMWKKIGFISGIIFLIITVCSNLFASQQKENLVNRNEAIVMNPSVTVRSTPSESGTSLFILHEGRKVNVKDNSMKEWKEIHLEDGKVGWVPASAIEVI